MAGVRPPGIITTDRWGAKRPSGRLTIVPRSPARIIFHHTAGHHREIENPRDESLSEATRYARDIQDFHMGSERGWLDSGHNYLVTLAGHVLVGRHFSFTMTRVGLMVESAHCPGQNDQVGIEHEHLNEPSMPKAQLDASARLHAWLMSRCGIRVSEVYPHGHFFPTSCPAQLEEEIRKVKLAAAAILNREGREPAKPWEKTAGLRWWGRVTT